MHWNNVITCKPLDERYVLVKVNEKHHILPHWYSNKTDLRYCYGSGQPTDQNITHWTDYKD